MRARSVLVTVATAAVVVIVPGTAQAAPAELAGANPINSFLPDTSTVDYAAWRQRLARQAASHPQVSQDRPAQHESEPQGATNRNDNRWTAEPVRGLAGDSTVRIAGGLAGDTDVFRVELRPGDVFAAKLEGAAHRLSIVDPSGVEVQGSAQDLSFEYPAASPLPRGGNAIADHVAAVGGPHYVAVSDGTGDYTLTLQRLRRPPNRAPQTIFLDFDGATIDSGIFPEQEPGQRTLRPFRTFLAGWGLTDADEPAVIRQVVATVTENLSTDVLARGNNPRSRVIVRSSLDTPDPFGRRNVSRVIVGGTTAELGFTTVGIAQSIDPGNFATEETAVVLQDFLSQPAGPGVSLNTYLGPASDRVRFVGRAIGNVVSHEAAHFLGCWHTDPTNPAVDLTDAGGAGYTGMFGTGPDGIGGTADDTDTDLTTDTYRPSEGFTGIEDGLNRVAFGT